MCRHRPHRRGVNRGSAALPIHRIGDRSRAFLRELADDKSESEPAPGQRSESLRDSLCASYCFVRRTITASNTKLIPWMSRARGAESRSPKQQWKGLYDTLSQARKRIHLVEPQPKLPDMVFTANAGLTVGKKFIPSNFRHQERAGEAKHFADWMEEHGYEIIWLPEKLYFEGEGDALFGGDALFCGYKFRSDIKSHRAVRDMFSCLCHFGRAGRPAVLSPRHLLLSASGWRRVLVSGSVRRIRTARDSGSRSGPDRVSEEEAAHFSCNAVVLEKRNRVAGRRAQTGRKLAGAWLPMSHAPHDRILEGGRRLQMPNDVFAAARASLKL